MLGALLGLLLLLPLLWLVSVTTTVWPPEFVETDVAVWSVWVAAVVSFPPPAVVVDADTGETGPRPVE